MDDQFSRWLAVREPADAEARCALLTRTATGILPQDRPLHLLDLGTGTGSNVRYMIERLPPRQHWVLVDRDAELLAEILPRMAEWAAARGYETRHEGGGMFVRGDQLDCRIETRCVDLSLVGPDLFAGQDLVTGSALLDLVSDRWLHALADACAASRTAVLFALTYSGGSRCTPAEPEDERVRDLINRHQYGDKGFGPAAGPGAVDRAAAAFARVGYVVQRAQSDWVLTPEATELQARLIQGWHQAAAALEPGESLRIGRWLARRIGHLTAGRSEVTVSHEDLAAWPAP
jgi:hypothetical protein